MHLPFSFLKGYLIKEIENFFLCFYKFIEILGEHVRNSKLRGNTVVLRARVPMQLLVSRAFPSCFYTSIETQKMFSIS